MLPNFLPNALLVLALLGFFVLIVRKLPKAHQEVRQETKTPFEVEPKVELWAKFKFVLKKLWTKILEAKGLRQQKTAGYSARKIWKKYEQIKQSDVLIPPVILKPRVTDGVRDEEYYLELIKLDPKNIDNFVGLAKFYVDQKQFDNALKVYEYLTRLEPGSASHYAKLGFCQYQLENFTLAVGSYVKAIALDNTQPSRYYNLGLAFEALQNWKGALKAFEQARLIDPENDKYSLAIARIKALRRSAKAFSQND